MKRSLYWKIVGTLMAVLVVSTVLNGAFLAFMAKGVARRTQEMTLGRYARYIARQIGYALSTGARKKHLPDLLRASVEEFPNVQIAFAPNGEPAIGTPDAEPVLLRAAERGGAGLVLLGGWPRKAGLAPVRMRGQVVGTVAVAVAANYVVSVRAVIGWSGVLMFPLLTLFSAVIGLIALRFLRRRLSPITDTLSAIRAGDLSRRLPEQDPDEIGELFTVFNEMVARVEQTVKRLGEVDQRRREFLIEIAHELKTPLTAVQGSLETVMTGSNPSAGEQHLARAYGEAVRIAGLVADLLESARMEEPRYSLKLAPLEVQRLVARVLERYSLLTERRGIQVKTRFTESPIVARLDERRMEQVVSNLLQNALDHTAQGCTLEVTTALEHGKARLEFRDNGEGMDPERLRRVRDGKFSSKGSGVGLIVVRKLVELHGGALAVESESGKGTRVTITLPASAS